MVSMMGRLRPSKTQVEKPHKELLAITATPHKEVVITAKTVTARPNRIKSASKKTPLPSVAEIETTPPELTWVAGEAPGRCAASLLGGPAAQDKVISAIQLSESWEDIRLMGYTFDYQPLVAALCTAKTAAPERRVEVVLDRAQTLSGPTRNQNAMARQLLEAGVGLRLARGNRLSPVYQEAGRTANVGSFMGALHAKSIIIGSQAFIGSTNWTVSSRANLECSVNLQLDANTAEEFNTFFDAVWDNAEQVSTIFLMDEMNERLRIRAARMSTRN
jgi:phosphatidylserine/phosphatidylglycerophosphate/cardiolipin synthase-like enzyme